MSYRAIRMCLIIAIVGVLAVLMLTVDMYLNDEPIDSMTLVLMLVADLSSIITLWNLLGVWRKARREERKRRRSLNA